MYIKIHELVHYITQKNEEKGFRQKVRKSYIALIGEIKKSKIKITAEINLMENAAYVVIGGQLTKVTPKQFGEDTIIWKDGKVLDVIRSQRVRMSGQDVI